MENEFDSSVKKGFSRRAQNDEFRELMQSQLNKNFKNLLVVLPIVFVFVVAITIIVCKIKGSDLKIAFATDILVMFIMIIILAVNSVKFLKKRGKLKLDSVDGVIVKREKFTSNSDSKSRKPKYLIVIQSDDGKKIKIKNDEASKFYPYVEKGDKVRYHPGFVFPIEIFDKSKSDVNICVFCGAKNSASADKCEACGKPMLI